MGKFTIAYSALGQRLKEVDSLVSSSRRLERADPVANAQLIRALCRGALVLMCSHMEAYVRDLGELALLRVFESRVDRARLEPRFFYNISRASIEEIRDTSDHTSLAEKMFTFIDLEKNYWNDSGPFSSALPSETFSKGFSSPSFKNIQKYLNRFGYDGFHYEVKCELRGNFLTCQTAANQLVSIRNQIAHGDATASMTPTEVRDQRGLILLFCRSIDSVFGSWCKENLCSIR